MGRAPCCSKVGLRRGPWTTREDTLLVNCIQVHGDGNWHNVPKESGLLRCGKSCRLRWMNYLRPDIKRGNITTDEDDLIIRLHSLLGNRWSLIAGRLPGRTDNEIKNYWNSHLGKKLKTTSSTSPNITNKSAPKHLKGKQKKVHLHQHHNTHTVNNSSQRQQRQDEDLGVTVMDSTKIHIPKPGRPKAFVIVRNQSFDSVASGLSSCVDDEGDIQKEDTTTTLDRSRVFEDLPPWSCVHNEGDIQKQDTTTTLDRSRVFDDLPPWSCVDDEGDIQKEDATTTLDRSCFFDDLPSWSSHFTIDCDDHDGDDTNEEFAYISCQSYPNSIMLDQLYEEYQQLLKVEDDPHVDAFVESLLD